MRLLQSRSAAVAVALVLAAATATHPLSPEPRIKRRFDEKPPLRPRVKGGYSTQPIHAHPQPAAAAPQVVGLSAPALGEHTAEVLGEIGVRPTAEITGAAAAAAAAAAKK